MISNPSYKHLHTPVRGFTLIELLLYVSIASLLLLGMTAFLSMMLGARVKTQTIIEVDEQGFEAMDIIRQTIRNATSITTPATSTSAGGLTLVVPSIGSNPTTFTSSSGVLYMTEGTAGAVPLTNSLVAVSNLTFTNVSGSGTPGSIRIMFTLTRQNTSGQYEYVYSRTFIGSASLRFP